MNTNRSSELGPALRVVGVLSAMSLAIMMLVTVTDVVSANVLHRPIVGAFDLVSTVLVFAVFLGIPITFRQEANIVVDVIDHFAAPRAIASLRLVARILALVFLGILLYNMIEPATDAYRYGEKKQELGLALYWIWVPILLGVAMSMVAVLQLLFQKRQPMHGGQEGNA